MYLIFLFMYLIFLTPPLLSDDVTLGSVTFQVISDVLAFTKFGFEPSNVPGTFLDCPESFDPSFDPLGRAANKLTQLGG